jgi:hypothetical protein
MSTASNSFHMLPETVCPLNEITESAQAGNEPRIVEATKNEGKFISKFPCVPNGPEERKKYRMSMSRTLETETRFSMHCLPVFSEIPVTFATV